MKDVSAFEVTPPPPPVATAVTIRRSASSVRAGRALVLSGDVWPAGLAGSRIYIYVLRPGSRRWSLLAAPTAYASGGPVAWQYRYVMRRSLRRGTYRFRAVVPAESANLGSSSAIVTVRLR